MNAQNTETDSVRPRIRRIFLNRHPHVALFSAADLLGISFAALKKEIDDGAILAVSTGVGLRIPREEMIAVAMRVWPQAEIEEALGEEEARMLPEAIRLVELRARIPPYQREMLQVLARRNETTVDEVLTRELEDVACAHSDELSRALPGFDAALASPQRAGARA
jgi:predicted DNA-binding transcriptional regulator AlpA